MNGKASRAVFDALLRLIEGCDLCTAGLETPSRRVDPHISPQFPVDIVYTWVDGNDPKHIEKRRAWEEEGVAGGEGSSPVRFRDNEELRYSLRSLEAYAPWVNKVYIVTDNQIPAWLDSGYERVCIVDHAEIIPERYLPTFNSHVIECYLHRIPSLSEHYIYFNDDFLLTNHCAKGDFFTSNGMPFIFCDWKRSRLAGYQKRGSANAASFYNVLDYMAAHSSSRVVPVITAHIPCPMSRDAASRAFAFFQRAIEGFSSHRFRGMDEMAFYCHAAPIFACNAGEAAPCDVPYYYLNVKRPDRRLYYSALLRRNSKSPLFACLNDVPDKTWTERWESDMRRFLSSFLPRASKFEKPSPLSAPTQKFESASSASSDDDAFHSGVG